MRLLFVSIGTLVSLALIPASTTGPADAASSDSPEARFEGPEAISRDALLDTELKATRGRVSPAQPFETGRAGFAVRLNGQPVRLRIHSLLVLPGSVTEIDAEKGSTLRYAAGEATGSGPGTWRWQAPDSPGIVPLRVEAPTGQEVELIALVLHPATDVDDGLLGGYRIGSYRREPLHGLPQFLPPEGFVRAAPEDEDIRISPHFTLGELLCKQPGMPRYATFTGALVNKLELLLEEVNARGIDVGTLTVMSGFRTPWYNRSIGNTTDYSRHLWGDAADVFIDRDRDGNMDDLNGDGRSTHADAEFLSSIVESIGAKSPDDGFTPGGLSVYRRNAAHGPFVHIDARGHRARW